MNINVETLNNRLRNKIGNKAANKATPFRYEVPSVNTNAFNATTPTTPSAGALQRGNSAREYMQTQAASATAEAMAGGGYGNTASALGALAQNRNQAGLAATQAANQIVETDLANQIKVALANQDTQLGVAGINQGYYNSSLTFESQLRNLALQASLGDKEAAARLRAIQAGIYQAQLSAQTAQNIADTQADANRDVAEINNRD